LQGLWFAVGQFVASVWCLFPWHHQSVTTTCITSISTLDQSTIHGHHHHHHYNHNNTCTVTGLAWPALPQQCTMWLLLQPSWAMSWYNVEGRDGLDEQNRAYIAVKHMAYVCCMTNLQHLDQCLPTISPAQMHPWWIAPYLIQAGLGAHQNYMTYPTVDYQNNNQPWLRIPHINLLNNLKNVMLITIIRQWNTDNSHGLDAILDEGAASCCQLTAKNASHSWHFVLSILIMTNPLKIIVNKFDWLHKLPLLVLWNWWIQMEHV